MIGFIKSCCLILLLSLGPANAYYSEPYDQELDSLILAKPQEVLQRAQANLKQAQQSQNPNEELIALFYIANALDFLSEQQPLDDAIERGLALAEKHNNLVFKSEFIGLLASRLELKGDHSAALTAINQALQIARETEDERLIAQQLGLRGEIHYAANNLEQALKDLEASTSIFKNNNDTYNLGIVYNLMALVYARTTDFEKAIKYYQESYRLDPGQSPYNQSALYHNLGNAYYHLGEYDKAIDYYNQSSEIDRNVGDMYSLAFAQTGIAEIHLIRGEIQQAETIMLPLFEIFKNNNDSLMLFESHLIMAKLKTTNQQHQEALNHLAQAEQLAETLNLTILDLKLLESKIAVYAAKKDWQTAYQLQNQYTKLNQEIVKSDQEQLTTELKIKFDAQFNQEKLDLLQQQNQLQQTVIEQQETTKKYLWYLLLLGSILLIITFLAYRTQKRIKRHLAKLSLTDSLTQVANRRHIIEQLKQLHAESINNQQAFTAIMIDLDYFKSINDTFGHETGNEVLIYFAQTAQTIVAELGEVGRIGGEEWLLLLRTSDLTATKQKLNALRTAFKNHNSDKIPPECHLSFSSGVVICHGQYTSYEKMLNEIDAALYQAKQDGREQDVYI